MAPAETPPSVAAPLLDRVETITLSLTAVGTGLGFLLGGSPKALAIALGGLFATLNFRGLRLLIKAILASQQTGAVLTAGRKAGIALLALAKFVVFYGAVWLLLTRTPVDRIGFILGFSSFVVAIGLQGLWSQAPRAALGNPNHG